MLFVLVYVRMRSCTTHVRLTDCMRAHHLQARILCLAQSPDGGMVASAAADETLRLWKCWAVDKQAKKSSTKTTASTKGSVLSKGIR